jgi:hypothetical protein
MKSPSGFVPRKKFSSLDRIENADQLCLLLEVLNKTYFCLGILGNETELPYERIAEWKEVQLRRYKGRLFATDCHRTCILPKRTGKRLTVRCDNCKSVMKSLKNAESYERKRISERVKVSYSTVVIPSEEEKEMIREAEHWASTTEILTPHSPNPDIPSVSASLSTLHVSSSFSNSKPSDVSTFLLKMIATSNDAATSFSSFSLLLEHIPGSLILIERSAFKQFFIPLARVFSAMIPAISNDLRPALSFLRSHSALKSHFLTIQGAQELSNDSILSLYSDIVEHAFRNFFGGGVLPVLTRRIRSILKSSKKNNKKTLSTASSDEDEITSIPTSHAIDQTVTQKVPVETPESCQSKASSSKDCQPRRSTPKPTDQTANVRRRLSGYENIWK